MMNTEEQARKLWCPMVRQHAGTNGEVGGNTGGCGCIASACSQWRWAVVDEYDTVEKYCASERAAMRFIVQSNSRDHLAVKGYCGRAGRPE